MAKKKSTKKSTKKTTKKTVKKTTEKEEEIEEIPKEDEDKSLSEEESDSESDSNSESASSGIENAEDFGKVSPFVSDSLNYDVKDLPGVGAATLKKLQDAGYITLQAIAMTPQKTIMEDTGLGDKTSASIIKAARETLHLTYVTADQVWESWP